jgi:flavodoxin
MKTAILYYFKHHGNTRKLVDAIKDADDSVTLIVGECCNGTV